MILWNRPFGGRQRAEWDTVQGGDTPEQQDRQPNAGDYPDLVRAGRRSYRTMTLQLSDKAAAGSLSGDPEKIGQMYWAALHGPLMLQMSGLLERETARARSGR